MAVDRRLLLAVAAGLDAVGRDAVLDEVVAHDDRAVLAERHVVLVGANKPIITALLEDGESSSTTLRHNASSNIFRFYTGSTGNDVALYKANGEVRAISSTLTDFYDAVKSNEYLVCNASGTGSKVDFESMIDLDEFDALTTEDFETLKY